MTEEGPDHAKVFAAQVLLGGTPRGEGAGRTKKEAEQNAAAAAYTTLQADGPDHGPDHGPDGTATALGASGAGPSGASGA